MTQHTKTQPATAAGEQSDTARRYQVTRNCCTSGYCFECHAAGRTGRPARIVHADRLTKSKAGEMARNWSAYDAKVSEMPQPQPAAGEGI